MAVSNSPMDGSPLEIFDDYTWEKNTKIITRDVHNIPGMANFSHFNQTASQPPTPPHIHSDLMELHFVVKGHRHSRIHSPNGSIENYTCTGNEAFIVLPGEIHSSGLIAREPCETFAIQLDTTIPERFLGLSPHMAVNLCERLMNLRGRKLRVSSTALHLLRTAFHLLANGDRESSVAHIVCFLFDFTTMPVLEEAIRTPGDSKISRTLRYIEENISEPMSVADLAAISGYSLSRLKSKFHEETGCTPGAYITKAKVEAAKRLLSETDQSITEIAVNLGWSTANYFCSVFKKLTGQNPLRYRRNSKAHT